MELLSPTPSIGNRSLQRVLNRSLLHRSQE